MAENISKALKKELKTSSGKFYYYSLKELEKNTGFPISSLPYSIRVLLECALRNNDGFAFTNSHIETIANWNPKDQNREEIPYKPARVVLQDFTGVPAVVDLAAMRDAIKRLGASVGKINPLVPCDLVIDHSVQVDHFGTSDALSLNEKIEFHRNKERYEFLKWGQSAFENFRIVPPSTGIVHQVNLEYLSKVVFCNKQTNVIYPDSCVGTDSHTPMVNGLGVLAWGVGGIEAEAVMLDQPIYMLLPDVIGFKLVGKMPEGTTATDLVLKITELSRKFGVVGKFLEFFGPGLENLSVADRATIGNMSPEHGCTVSFFPVDEATLDFMRQTGRSNEDIEVAEAYYKEQGLFRNKESKDPIFSDVIELDLANIEPSIAGPKRPQDRIALKDVGPTYKSTLTAPVGPKGLGINPEELNKKATFIVKGQQETLEQGSVVIAAITSCTNTSNPSVMLGAGLVAKKAVEKGIRVKKFVKTSLAPGSTVVTEYLKKSGLLPYLEELGFNVVGYGCTTCIGNSGPLDDAVSKTITDNNLVVSAVLSGNRNFEGRVHPLTRTNYLASPPLVVAYAIAGSTALDISKEAIAKDQDGNDVFLKDIWPSTKEVQDAINSSLSPEMFKSNYKEVFKGSSAWQDIETIKNEIYQWKDSSTYIQAPPFFESVSLNDSLIAPINKALALGMFADSVTTDHISPAGSIAKNSPAAIYLKSLGVNETDFNSYGSRRGNHHVMMRGTFANIRIKNLLCPGKEGNFTIHHPSKKEMSFFDASVEYQKSQTPLIIIAGKEYGSGSSRDWAAKGPYLLGIKAVIAESYERIHRSNLVGMGILPLEFINDENASKLGLDGTESYSIKIDNETKPQEIIEVIAEHSNGKKISFKTRSRIDTPVEIQYYRDGGILCTVLKNLAKS